MSNTPTGTGKLNTPLGIRRRVGRPQWDHLNIFRCSFSSQRCEQRRLKVVTKWGVRRMAILACMSGKLSYGQKPSSNK